MVTLVGGRCISRDANAIRGCSVDSTTVAAGLSRRT